MTVLEHTHPIVNGVVLLPGHMFSARNRISGRVRRYTYRSLAGGDAVNAVDQRGNSHTIARTTIVRVHRNRPPR